MYFRYQFFFSILFIFWAQQDGFSQQNLTSGNQSDVLTCNNWLSLPSQPAYVDIGDLDISGNKITIEAIANRTSFQSNGVPTDGDLVSKHTGPTNANYILRPTRALITTSDGFYYTPDVCGITLNKIYHYAMVYDGASLKFYRNGFLMSQVPATGNLVLNDLITRIGFIPNSSLNENFIGYINEVRIWNVARTQQEIRSYMNSSLPNPATQAGLQAYYVFDNLLNKQGNTAWNGTLGGTGIINSTNPQCTFTPDSCNVIVPVTVNFSAPDTVCVNAPIQVVNNSIGTTNQYWSFCETDFSSAPVANNLGNPSGVLNSPVFTDIVQDDAGNFFAFTTNNLPQGIVRYDYGNSLLNTPTANFLGNPGNALPLNCEGIQLIKQNNNWFGFVVGGDPVSGNPSGIVTVSFGPVLTNPSPSAVNWGNLGNMDYPIDLFVYTENNNWYGYTVNFRNSTITKFNFGNDFTIAPTAVNLGNIGGMQGPVGIGDIKVNGNWHLFITNEAPGNSITRLSFGNSLNNTPTAVNIGNPGGLLDKPRDITFLNLCEGIYAISVNAVSNSINKFDFQNNILSSPTAVSLGNLGNLNFPHSISKIFREDSDIYALIPNVNSNSLTRLRFQGCSGVPGSAAFNPGPVTYAQPGTYNINLISDIGLASQQSYCKTIVVKDCAISNIANIINDYTPVIALNPCNNSITVEDATAFNTGDTVLMIQMKGASVDSTNTASFGGIQQINNAGNYEYNYVKAITGNIIELKNKLTRQYDLPDGKVQLVRVPYYYNANITGTLTCLPWNGSIGGVLALNVRDTIYLNGYINVSGMGFRGAQGTNTNQALVNCDEDRYYYASVDGDSAARKGESIAELSDTRIFGKGKLASAGGGGNSHNSGGGGGANGGAGGTGGYQVAVCTPAPFDNRGIGGNALTYNNGLNKIFMGGGGGAGHVNNSQGFTGDGGNGGGIAIITGNTLVSASGFIISNANNGKPCTLGGSGCHEGMGGGGAGGTILLNIENYINNVTVNAIGGNGGVMTDAINGLLGPGGGGGGGTIWFKPAAVPSEVLPQLNGGINGTCINQGNNDWGATSGTDGINVFNLNIPVDTALFVPNIDSVKINESAVSCNEFNFNGLGYTNTSPINNWQWNFGDNGTASTQNASHLYTNPGVYDVKLIITDINGCKDSISKSITVTCAAAGDTIINLYTPVLSYNVCDNSFTVENASGYNAGDTVLLIQMKGAVIDSSNTPAFGNIIDYKNAGNYEYNYISQVNGNNIALKNKITRQYDIPTGKVQLVRTPYYFNISFTNKLTCLPWDGSKGGIVAFNVRDTLSLANDIDVSGKGFRGGSSPNSNMLVVNCNSNGNYYPEGNIRAADKGETIYELATNKKWGKAPVASGGGGGMDHNSGGGGGGNGGMGGKGGFQVEGCGTFDNGGIGGNSLAYSTVTNKIFMGGGGGSGHANNPGGSDMNGGRGGGIIIISSKVIIPNANKILAKGANGVFCDSTLVECNDGNGGGGGGGTILLKNNLYTGNTAIDASGGNGGNLTSFNPALLRDELGPGGGGGGGITWFNSPIAPANTNSILTGGLNGVIISDNNNPFGAVSGNAGLSLFNLSIPIDTVLFKPNIDSVRFNETALSCNEFNFNGIAYTNTTPITTWQWNFGDNNTAFTQNTSHTYAGSGTYTVTLLVTDINGCKDSIVKNVTITGVLVNAGNDTSYCSNAPVTHVLQGTTNGSGFSWTPAAVLNNPSILNPTATISTTTTFYLTATSSTASCTSIDSVTITVNPLPAVATIADASICRGDSIQLNTISNANTYSWAPPLSVSNSGTQNPYFTDTMSQVMVVTGTNTSTGCTNSDNVLITVNPSPIIRTRADTSLCGSVNITLNTTGGQAYSWSPATNLSNPSIASPVFNGTAIQTYNYIVTGSGPNGCTAKDTVNITINEVPAVNTIAPVSICRGDSVLLTTNSNAQTHQWSPPLSVNNSGIQNPYFTDTVSQVMIVTGTNNSGCFSKDTVNITVRPSPIVRAVADTSLCGPGSYNLLATGGQSYRRFQVLMQH